jgi:hypothetical protein
MASWSPVRVARGDLSLLALNSPAVQLGLHRFVTLPRKHSTSSGRTRIALETRRCTSSPRSHNPYPVEGWNGPQHFAAERRIEYQ